MQKVFNWAKRRRYILIGGTAFLLIGIAGYLGYLTSQSQAVQEIPAPPTVTVVRGEVLLSVTAPGQLTDVGQASLLSAVNGSLEQVQAQPGDIVSAGQILAKIGDRVNFEAEASNTAADLAQAQATLDAIDTPALLLQAHIDLLKAQQDFKDAQTRRLGLQYGRASQDTLDLARSNYVLAQTALNQIKEMNNDALGRSDTDPVRAAAVIMIASATQQRNKALANLNWLLGKPDANEVAQADAKVQLAKAKADSAQANYDRMLKGAFPELDMARANLKKAQAAMEKAQKNLDNLDIKAPYSGVIISVNVKTGQNVTNGQELFRMIDPHQMEVSATIVEEDLQIVKIGQAVQLYFGAVPEAALTGHLARIVPQRTTGDRVLYPIFISLDQVSKQLVSGMTVDASITIDKKENVLRLPRSVVHARANGTAELNVWDGTQSTKRLVKVGLRGDSFVEILSGLEEGNQVISK